MYSVQQITADALRTFMNNEKEKYGIRPAGGSIMDATTICVGNDTIQVIPLDILSDPVNLKQMWFAIKNPVAILFREWIYDWVALIPRGFGFREWDLIAMPTPGQDHDLYRARSSAERAVRCDFEISDARVYLN